MGGGRVPRQPRKLYCMGGVFLRMRVHHIFRMPRCTTRDLRISIVLDAQKHFHFLMPIPQINYMLDCINSTTISCYIVLLMFLLQLFFPYRTYDPCIHKSTLGFSNILHTSFEATLEVHQFARDMTPFTTMTLAILLTKHKARTWLGHSQDNTKVKARYSRM